MVPFLSLQDRIEDSQVRAISQRMDLTFFGGTANCTTWLVTV
jgi:hypothetical protein